MTETCLTESFSEKMLSISGTNSLRSKVQVKSTDFQYCMLDDPFSKEEPSNNKSENKILSSVSNDMSNRKKVQRLINSMKMKREINEEPKKVTHKNTFGSTGENSAKVSGASFHNRFLTQRKIIDMQRLKLMDQEKMITQLKLGIITKENMKKNDKHEMRQLFQNCKLKLLGKVPLDYLPQNQDLLVKTQPAPRIIQELERRALERIKYREIIKERKRKLEETKKQFQEENLRRKHQILEVERFKQLKMLNERQKKEQEKIKMRHVQKEKFLKNLNKAILFHEKNLLKRMFSIWKCDHFHSLNNWRISEEHHVQKILEKNFKILLDTVHSKYLFKCESADGLLKKTLLKKSLKGLKEVNILSSKAMQ